MTVIVLCWIAFSLYVVGIFTGSWIWNAMMFLVLIVAIDIATHENK